MRLIWLTDIHLNFVQPDVLSDFLREVADAGPDAVVLTGDVGEAHNVADYLARIDDVLHCPLHFVLGNHDFYFGSIAEVRDRVAKLCADRTRLRYLSERDVVSLTPNVGLVGHDGWADARLGNYARSYVMMNDYKLIRELAPYGKAERWPLLQALGDAAAAHLAKVLPEALETHQHVFLATHVPPLREACWHQGRISDDEWAPHFTCQATGEVILATMRKFPNRDLTVLCGHTHGAGECQPLPNVRIITGGAEYGRPRVCQVFEW